MECGIRPALVSVNSTMSPWRTWTIGPGISPSNVHAATTVSSRTRIGTSLAVKWRRVTRWCGSGGSTGSNRWNATAAAAVLPGADAEEDGIAWCRLVSLRLSGFCVGRSCTRVAPVAVSALGARRPTSDRPHAATAAARTGACMRKRRRPLSMVRRPVGACVSDIGSSHRWWRCARVRNRAAQPEYVAAFGGPRRDGRHAIYAPVVRIARRRLLTA